MDLASLQMKSLLSLIHRRRFNQELNWGMMNLMLTGSEERSGTDPSVSSEGSELSL